MDEAELIAPFATLYQRLDRSTATGDKRAALIDYFRDAPAADAAWALWLLAGGKIGGAKARIASSAELRAWIAAESGNADWLVDASYDQVGDLAENARAAAGPTRPCAPGYLARRMDHAAGWPRLLMRMSTRDVRGDRRCLAHAALRGTAGIQQIADRRLARRRVAGAGAAGACAVAGIDIALIAQRMLGSWTPDAAFMQRLLSPDPQPGDAASPYPFFLASPLENDIASLGDIGDWLIRWKWDGIRAQLIRRGTDIALWSRGEEHAGRTLPRRSSALALLPRDAVIDGELLAWRGDEDQPLPFTALQTRIGAKPGAKTLADTPAARARLRPAGIGR